jgi:hypothetical protein
MRNGWKSLLPLLLVLLGVAYLVLQWTRLTETRLTELRLYWEFAGRITHRSITEGYLERVHHLTGQLTPLESAVRLGHALAPYTEFPCEYPPGALLLFGAIRLAFDGLRPFVLAYGALVAACICVAALVMIRLVERQFGDSRAPALVALAFTVWVALTGSFLVTRFDSVMVLFVALALLAWDRKRESIAGLCLGLGASIKLWPAFLVPILMLSSLHSPRSGVVAARPALSLGIGALIGFALPHGMVVAMGTSPTDLLNYLSYYGDRPPEVESLQANLLVIGQMLGITTVTPAFDFGSHNVIATNWRTLSHIFSLAFGVSYLGALLCVLKSGHSRRTELLAMGFVTITLILCSKVFSGEYMIWILPFALLAVADKRWGAVTVYGIALMFLKFVYWNWNDVIALKPFATFLVSVKNVACVAMACLFAREMIRVSFEPGSRAAGNQAVQLQANKI